MIHTHTFEVGGKTFSIETGRVAKQAGGAVLLGVDETVVLGTATMSKGAREGIDFLPLVCDFEERKYSVGKIPGGFFKRGGGRPSEKATLISRLIDRPIRPLFPYGMRNEIQVITMAFASDSINPYDVLALNAAGAALAVSDIPFGGPVGATRVGRIDGKFIAFPTNEEILESDIDLVVAGHKGAISMVEAGANEVDESDMVEALEFGHEIIKQICVEFEKLAKMVNKPKREAVIAPSDEDLKKEIFKSERDTIVKALNEADKATREGKVDDVTAEIKAKYEAKYADDETALKVLNSAIDGAIKEVIRTLIIKDGIRPDGRKPDELRDLEAMVGLLPRVHGSGMFTRGQTQVMSVLTLGMPGDAQKVDTPDSDGSDKRYMHFYNFPPYSVGEARMLRGPGRREIGHGILAERALLPVIPLDDPDFPYTLHVTSEVLESNGSTSMASVCGSTLALMDAGVPILAPVAGIAMGLMSDGKDFRVLTDIQGVEDFTGDMDFKVAGTRKGITALQLDTKLDGIPKSVLEEALGQAKEARMKILDVIEAEIPEPRASLSKNAPRISTIQIPTDSIGSLIGPGGANIRKLTEVTGTQIDIQQDGRVLIGADDGEKAEHAIRLIKEMTMVPEIGMEFTGKVTRLFGRGAMVEYSAGKEGLVPTQYLSDDDVKRPDDVVSVGDEVSVIIVEVDSQGRINLAIAGVDHASKPKPMSSGRNGGGGRYDRDRGGRGGGDRDRGDRGGYDRDRGGRGGPRGDRDSRGGGDRDRGGERGRGGDRERTGTRDRGSERGGDRDRGGDRGGFSGGGRDRDADRGRDRGGDRDSGRDRPREDSDQPRDDVNARFRPRR